MCLTVSPSIFKVSERAKGCSACCKAELHCTTSVHWVETELAGGEAFSCPAYFRAQSCCERSELQQIWEKVWCLESVFGLERWKICSSSCCACWWPLFSKAFLEKRG